MEKTKKLNVGLTYYNLDISKPEEKQQYNNIVNKAKLEGHKKDIHHWVNFQNNTSYDNLMKFYDKIKKLSELNHVEIETKYLFSNQFNTSDKSFNLRVYYWSEIEYKNPNIKEGYFLIDCQKLKELVHNTFKCGYCGKQYTKEEHKNLSFCDSCLDSEYLTEDNLILLRLKRIDDKSSYLPLNDCDKETLTKAFIKSQIKGNSKRAKARIKAKRTKLLKDYKDKKINAENEYKGFIWCMDKGINTNNLIYYNHSQTFCFGWRKPLGIKEVELFKKTLKDFPYKVEFKTTKEVL